MTLCPGAWRLWEVSLLYRLNVQKNLGYYQNKLVFFFLAIMVLQVDNYSLHPVNEKRHACDILKVDINIEAKGCVCVAYGLFIFLNTAMTVL